MEGIYCKNCGNNDPRLFAVRSGKLYCRKCLLYSGRRIEAKSLICRTRQSSLTLDYSLSEEQVVISRKILANYIARKNSLIYAVTGAGKTELIYKVVEYCLNNHLAIGFAIPRVDLVIELASRFRIAFPNNSIITVYGNHAAELQADIVLLTTHQLYRYEKYFDLLIIDEIDAFPFKGNSDLFHFFKRALAGNYIMLSATPSDEDIRKVKQDNGEVYMLMRRYHGKPMPVPIFIKESFFPRFQLLNILQEMISQDLPVLVFVPTVESAGEVGNFLRMFLKNGDYVSSKKKERKEVIEKFKAQHYKYLVTTTILERGITVRNLQVIIFQGDHSIFDSSTIIQIAGRVGRKNGATDGRICIIGKDKTDAISEAIRTIEKCNEAEAMPNLL